MYDQNKIIRLIGLTIKELNYEFASPCIGMDGKRAYQCLEGRRAHKPVAHRERSYSGRTYPTSISRNVRSATVSKSTFLGMSEPMVTMKNDLNAYIESTGIQRRLNLIGCR